MNASTKLLWPGVAALLVVGLLQGWRPYYFLTDDSLRLAWPVLVEQGHARAEGLDPNESQFLFGGGYRLDQDAMFTPNRHPLMAGLSQLAGTGWELAMVDLWCAIHAVLASVGFTWMTRVLAQTTWREGQPLSLAGPILSGLLALSYTFNGYTLYLGASGFWYWANVAALPWMVGALWDRNAWRGALILALGAWHMAVGGYPSCTLYAGGLLGGLALVRLVRTPEARVALAGWWLGAGVVAALAAWPWLGSVLVALPESVRSSPISPEIASEKAMPWAVLVGSWFVSSLSSVLGPFETFGKAAHAYALASCPLAWFFFCAWKSRRPWNGWDAVVLGSAVAVGFLVARPVWVSALLTHLPLLGSLRWPYKEVFLFLFLLHLWMLRGTRMDPIKAGALTAAGFVFFIAPCVLFGPPSLNEARHDRMWLMTGRAQLYRAELQQAAAGTRGIAPVLPDWALDDPEAYLTLPVLPLASHNYPAYFRIRSASGYSATLPLKLFYREPRAANVYGVFRERDASRLREEGWTTVTLTADIEQAEATRPDGQRVPLDLRSTP